MMENQTLFKYSEETLSDLKGALSIEDYERLEKFRPETLFAARRAGIKEAALVRLLNFFKKRRKK